MIRGTLSEGVARPSGGHSGLGIRVEGLGFKGLGFSGLGVRGLGV